MNANERRWRMVEVTETGVGLCMARRRFLAWCAVIGGGAFGLEGHASAASVRTSHEAAGPRELSLAEADFYQSHDLAG
jgi:hypothetical protein